MSIYDLKENLIYAFGGITLLDLLKTNAIIKLMSLHSHVYLSTSDSFCNILNGLSTIKNIKNVKIVNLSHISQLNLENSIIIVDYPKGDTINDLIILKDNFPSSTIIFCRKSMLLRASIKDRVNSILVNYSTLCIDQYKDFNSTEIIRLKYYVESTVIKNYIDQHKNLENDNICVCTNNKILNLKDFYSLPQQNKIDIFETSKYTLDL